MKAGYRLLDGAGDYGNEKEAGEGLARAIKDGVVKREDVCEYQKFGSVISNGLVLYVESSHHLEGSYSGIAGHLTPPVVDKRALTPIVAYSFGTLTTKSNT